MERIHRETHTAIQLEGKEMYRCDAGQGTVHAARECEWNVQPKREKSALFRIHEAHTHTPHSLPRAPGQEKYRIFPTIICFSMHPTQYNQFIRIFPSAL